MNTILLLSCEYILLTPLTFRPPKQVSQYTFAMCSFKEKKVEPTDMLNLDGYTIDYIEPVPELHEMGGKYFFNAVREGDSVYFACDDEVSRVLDGAP